MKTPFEEPFSITPCKLKELYPLTDEQAQNVSLAQKEVKDILSGKDQRLLLIVGPCSIHDTEATYEFATLLAELKKQVQDRFLILMRAHIEKPRTSFAWKGFLNDPRKDGSCLIEEGLILSRALLLRLIDLNLSLSIELLDPFLPCFLGDLISFTMIGARTASSQIHRQIVSGVESAIGFKNSVDGNIDCAIQGIKTASFPHTFLSIDMQGRLCKVKTSGNRDALLVLRGAKEKPNVDIPSLLYAIRQCEAEKIPPNILIDCSHGNAKEKPRGQIETFFYTLDLALQKNVPIKGMMLESNLFEGSQSHSKTPSYGISLTDPCLSFAETKKMILSAYQMVLENKFEGRPVCAL